MSLDLWGTILCRGNTLFFYFYIPAKVYMFWCKCFYFFFKSCLSWSCGNFNICMFLSDHYGVMTLKGCSSIESNSALLKHGIWCKPGTEVIKLFPCSTQLSTKFILLINVKMSTIVVILTFISMISTTSDGIKIRNICICQYFSFHELLRFRPQLS